LGKLAISSASLFLIFRKTDMEQVVYILKSIGLLAVLSAAVIYVASQFISTFRWKALLPDRYPAMRLFSLYMIGSFFSTFLPGLVGGDAIRAYYLNRDAKKISTALATVFMDRYLGYVSLIMIGMTAFPFTLGSFGGSVHRWIMPFIFVAFIIGSILFFTLRLGRRFRLMTEFYDYFAGLKKRRSAIAAALSISMLIQLIMLLLVLLLARSLGIPVSLLQLSVFMPIIITISSLPISISGIGIREGSFVILLGLIGVRPEAATSLSLAYFFSIFIGSLPGLAFYLLHGRQQAPEQG
jgi:glycosyltransferase 2 family protein